VIVKSLDSLHVWIARTHQTKYKHTHIIPYTSRPLFPSEHDRTYGRNSNVYLNLNLPTWALYFDTARSETGRMTAPVFIVDAHSGRYDAHNALDTW